MRGPWWTLPIAFEYLLPPVVPLQSSPIWSLVSGVRDGRRSRLQPAIAGGHPGNVADEQADDQGLGLIDTDLPACLIRFMHGSHLSLGRTACSSPVPTYARRSVYDTVRR